MKNNAPLFLNPVPLPCNVFVSSADQGLNSCNKKTLRSGFSTAGALSCVCPEQSASCKPVTPVLNFATWL